ncbi:DUF6082 family protein [Actinoplanes sp. KI2]|uniref:DUF6082 family protein n=1 Tax=Actinoplanes sp. KI2 TaxID=2983315 RepID=UPI0021D59385|nr:DUF6082 family protein [Actinoplanes sp. KI2]MCU7725079.1 DUF6082 family protein [Actinoplanes sp. KI2]
MANWNPVPHAWLLVVAQYQTLGEVGMIKSRRRLSTRTYSTAGAVVAIVATAAILLASPFVLSAVAPFSDDWSKLSDVGQSYGAAAAVFSGLAFIGVMFTLFTLNRQSAFQQALSLRSLHFDLLRTVIDHPTYERAMREGHNNDALPLWAYFNLRLQTIYFFWRCGEVDDANAEAEIGTLMRFGTFAEWWREDGAPLWNAGHQTPSERRFVSMVDEVGHRATRRTPDCSASVSAGAPGSRPVRQSRIKATGFALAAGAAFGASVASIAASRRGRPRVRILSTGRIRHSARRA